MPCVVEIATSYNHIKNIPVIAAGGIMNGDDIKKFMSLGASGVQMGSLFVPTTECDAADSFKETYINSDEKEIGRAHV